VAGKSGDADAVHRTRKWENGYCESFNGKLREELLMGRSFTRWEAQILIERWRQEYNTERPHSALGYRPPAPVAALRPAADLVSQSRAVM
jgi:putative transposase